MILHWTYICIYLVRCLTVPFLPWLETKRAARHEAWWIVFNFSFAQLQLVTYSNSTQASLSGLGRVVINQASAHSRRRENKECLWCLSTVCLLCRVIRTQTWTSLWFSNNEVSGCASNSCEPEASDCSKHLVSDRCLYSCLCMMSVRGDGPNVVRLSVYWGEPIREKVAHRLRKQRQWMNWEAPSYKSCELLCSSRMKNMQVEISIIGPL